MGGSASANKSKSKSNSKYNENVWQGQSGPLKELYKQAGQLFGGQDFGKYNDMAGGLDPYNQQLMQGGMQGYENQVGGGSFGDTSDVRDKLMESMGGPSQMGQMYNSIVGGEGNSYIDPMVDSMKQGANQQLQTAQSSAGLDATAAGQGGGSRHAMQNAMLGAETGKNVMAQEANMRGGAYDKDLAMKMGIAQQADQSKQSEQDRMMQMLSGSDRNRQAGMNSGEGMQQLGMGSMAPWMQAQQQPWNAMQNYAGALGGPTVLGSGGQSGSSKGAGMSGSGSMKGS